MGEEYADRDESGPTGTYAVSPIYTCSQSLHVVSSITPFFLRDYHVFHSYKRLPECVGRSEHGVNFQGATDLGSFHLASFPGLILL